MRSMLKKPFELAEKRLLLPKPFKTNKNKQKIKKADL